MSSRFAQHKPDPAIKRNVLRSRANMQKGKNGTALVISTSLAATIGAWILLANPSTPVSTDTQATDTGQYVTQITDGSNSSGSGLTLTPTPTPTSEASTDSTGNTVAYVAQPTAVAVTRSSQ
jgi:hypothetical protein